MNTIRLPARSTSARAAREHVVTLLSEWGIESGIRDDAALVVSELVSNVVVHAHGSSGVVCRLRDGADTLYLEVGAEGGVPVPRGPSPRPCDESGRGLVLVNALCTSWGVEDSGSGRGWTVWVRLPRAPLVPGTDAPPPGSPGSETSAAAPPLTPRSFGAPR